MAGQTGFMEFYVASNPPLLLNGVEFVINSALKTFVNGEIIELLYEPEIPWFKVICAVGDEVSIQQYLQDVLQSILHEDVTGIMNAHTHCQADDGHAKPDVGVLASKQRIIPWPQYHKKGLIDPQSFDGFRYPDSISSLEFKAVWRGFEHWKGQTTTGFLDSLTALWKNDPVQVALPQLEQLFGCLITHNLQANVLYLGSDENPQVVKDATKKLDAMVQLLEKTQTTSSHMILKNGDGPFKVAYRWHSQLGLARQTYVQTSVHALEDEYKRLMNSATLRFETKNEKGRWILDRTSYPIPGGLDPATVTVKSVFQDYRFTPRHPESSPVPEIEQGYLSIANSNRLSPNSFTESDLSQRPQTRNPPAAINPIVAWREGVQSACVTDVVRNDDEDLICLEQVESIKPKSTATVFGCASPNHGHLSSTKELSHSPLNSPIDLMTFDEEELEKEDDERFMQTQNNGLMKMELSALSLLDGPPEEFSAPIDLLSTPVPGDIGCTASHTTVHSTDVLLDFENASLKSPRNPYQTSGEADGFIRMSDRVHAFVVNSKTDDKPLSTAEQPKDPFLKRLIKKVKEMSEVLRLTPGKVSINLQFGRLFIKDWSHSQVNVGAGPSWNIEEVLDFLNNGDFPQECFGFSTILSTRGVDAGLLALLSLQGGAKWRLVSTETSYHFVCTDTVNIATRFLTIIDAENFEFHCKGLSEEVSRVYVHCPQHAWDFKVCCNRSRTFDTSSRHFKFASKLSASMRVLVDNESKLLVELRGSKDSSFLVDNLQIHHTARYKLKGNSSVLDITTVRPLSLEHKYERKRPAGGTDLLQIWAFPHATNLDKGDKCRTTQDQWIQASVSSAQTNDILNQNTLMGLGDVATWDCDRLEREAGFTDICLPGISMISQMDHIGQTNNNGQGLLGHTLYNSTLAEDVARNGQTEFW